MNIQRIRGTNMEIFFRHVKASLKLWFSDQTISKLQNMIYIQEKFLKN